MAVHPDRVLRPYQLMCAVCSLGEENAETADPRTGEVLAAIGANPDEPITLRCNAGDVFVYQDPGPDADTPGGAEYNISRDLEILHRLNLFPGACLPARIIVNRLLDGIEDPGGICGYGSGASESWPGCPHVDTGRYSRGRARGLDAIIPPRLQAEMVRDKEESLAAMRGADAIRVRPHILLCAVCQYGAGTRPPFPEDNLPELLALIFEEPGTPITLAPYADWMMCAPCPSRSVDLNGCVNNRGSGGLPNQMRDLRVLRKLGLTYGATVPAAELYRLIFSRIPGTLELCRIDQPSPSVWWTGCGAATTDSRDYERGRELLEARLG